MRFVLFFMLALANVPAAHAQSTDLPDGWHTTPLLAPLNTPRGMACSDSHAFIRGHTGVVGRFDGSTIETLPSPDTSRSAYGTAIEVTPDGVVFVLGSGFVNRFAANQWTTWTTERTSPAGFLALDAQHLLIPGEASILGATATGSRRYDAGTWRALEAIEGDASDFWAVGQGGVAMHWTGAAFTTTHVGRDVWLRGVARVAANDVWAYGPGVFNGRGASSSGLFHWDGSSWSDRSIEGHAIRGLMADPTHTFVNDETSVHRWDGGTWVEVLTAPEQRLGMACRTATHAFILDERGAVLWHTWP